MHGTLKLLKRRLVAFEVRQKLILKYFEVLNTVASVATYEGLERGVNPISVFTEFDWPNKGCGRPLTFNSDADPEG